MAFSAARQDLNAIFDRITEQPEYCLTRTGHVKAYNRQLSRLIEHDLVKPSWIVSHELALADAAGAYASFDQRKAGWTKVVIKPGK
jgi:threonine dehydrogenase-like Zn-dependent dehydrogenase